MTRASDLAKLLGAGATINDGTTITTADNTAQLELVSTDADSGIGPHQVFYRNSSSPADADLLCELDFRGRNDNSQDVNYATVNVKASDVSDGTEDGEYILQVMTAGSVDTTMHIKPAEIVFNEDSIDRDFRVESNGNANMLFVDGGNDRVGIGTNAPTTALHVKSSTSDVRLQLTNSASADDTTGSGASFQLNNDDLYINAIEPAGKIYFRTDGGTGSFVERMKISGSGNTKITSLAGSDYVLRLHNDRNNNDGYGLHLQVGADDPSGTHYQIDFADGDGTIQGSISSNSGTVTYGAFTAFHPCIIPNADNDADSVANAYPYGTLLEITSLSYTQKNGADTERGILYNVQKSSSAKSKAVLGAYGSSMNSEARGDTNLHQALILGDGHILCNNENGNIAVGDYICTSSVSGEGMKATSICTTIGIAREAITFSNSTAVLVAVEYGYRQFIPEDLEARITALESA